MRILQLIDSMAVGGAERMAVNIANLFSKENIPNILVASRSNGPMNDFLLDKESFLCLHKKSFSDFKAFRQLISTARNFKPTHIHVHDSSVFWGVMLKQFLPSSKLVWHAHYGGFSGNDQRFGNKIKFIAGSIDAVITVNEELKDWIEKELPKIHHVAYIQNFPDLPEAVSRQHTAEVILCLANLKPPKNHHLLVNAFLEFVAAYPGYKLKLVGSTDNPVYLSEIQEMISRNGMEDSIHIEGTQLNLTPYMEEAQFAVLSSDVEGLPVSLLELGLGKVPIITTAVGQCEALFEKGKFGYLVEPGKKEELLGAMLHVAANISEAKNKAELFASHVSAKFGNMNFLGKYTNLLNGLS
ncbi:glycosyltransferase [Algoriphagus aquimarinus]|uniref:Glycosyltransferase involved in cell wall bisynthesis n=1 Tax=Algoriphagus aquimarinus TaxID=237018 RepID=A0A1I0ZXV7_9BACT|nr:glycosyltransferase [Algoriphagus aquimarinus]SFB30441.1 Glycosyltransferase involved in cell wall bisynthesis [Algoriphagus aquimarinus]